MVFEAHGMSFLCTELLLFNYAKVKTVFHSMAPLKLSFFRQEKSVLSDLMNSSTNLVAKTNDLIQ